MATLAPGEKLLISEPPTDGITAVKFSPGPNPDLLAASSWDCTVTLYCLKDQKVSAKHKQLSPVFDLCFVDSNHVVSGTADAEVTLFDIAMGQTSKLGKLCRPVSVTHHNIQHEMLLVGSWDSTVNHFDIRSPSPVPLKVLQQPDSVVTMDSMGHNLVVGTTNRHVWWWDLRKLDEPVEKRESSLKYSTRCLRCFANHQGYVLGSIEGRVALEVFDQNVSDIDRKKYAFKCHREKSDMEYIYPVTALAIHPIHNTFATGGCDSTVAIWDGMNKKRLTLFPKFPTGISSLAFSDDGNYLAIASSYMYENGPMADEPAPSIAVRSMNDNEVRPKQVVQ